MRRVVGTLDGNGDLRGARQSTDVLHGVSEDIRDGVAGGTQSLDGHVRVIDRVSVITIGCNID